MLKHLASALIVLSTATAAFAQNPTRQDMRLRDVERPRSQFSQYLMKGFSAGIEYSMLNGNNSVKMNNSSGESTTYSSSTGREAATAGVSVNYGSLPRNDFGLLFGMGLLKKLEDNKTSPSDTLASSGPLTQIRPDFNAAYSLPNGLYGAAGANLSHLIIENESDALVSTLGLGLQAQVGYIPMRNLGMDVGYYVSRHPYKNMTISNGTTTIKVNSSESYVDLTQLRFRLSYLF